MALPAKKLAVLASAWLVVPMGLAYAQQPQSDHAPTGTVCGGVAGFGCPEGDSCVDDPRDDCDPNNGGADCSGICVSAADQQAQPADGGTQACDTKDPEKTYVSTDPEQCAAIRFACETGKEPFFNDCGCGCQPVAQ